MAQGGKSLNDREKSATVRNKVLDAMLLVYNGEADNLSQRQWELTLKMASTILPRLNEHTGKDGDAIEISGVDIVVRT